MTNQRTKPILTHVGTFRRVDVRPIISLAIFAAKGQDLPGCDAVTDHATDQIMVMADNSLQHLRETCVADAIYDYCANHPDASEPQPGDDAFESDEFQVRLADAFMHRTLCSDYLASNSDEGLGGIVADIEAEQALRDMIVEKAIDDERSHYLVHHDVVKNQFFVTYKDRKIGEPFASWEEALAYAKNRLVTKEDA